MRISDWSSDVCSSELWADVVVMLFPDEEQARVYREELAPNLRPGAALAFAHGLAIRFALIEPRPDLDVFLVAPTGPGTALREEYLKDGGPISLFAVHKDPTGSAPSTPPSSVAAPGRGRAA